jgi:hypothetical protein
MRALDTGSAMFSEVASLRRSHFAMAFVATVNLVLLFRNHEMPAWVAWLGGAMVVGALWWNWRKPSVNGLLWYFPSIFSPFIVGMMGR